MDVVFGLWTDSAASPDHGGEGNGALGAPVVGPSGLLEILETARGLGSPSTANVIRIAAFQSALERMGDRPRFWSRSSAVDAWATARTVLRWRDELIDAGWVGAEWPGKGPSSAVRLKDLAEADEAASDVAPGIADRAAALVADLASRPVLPIRRIRLIDPREVHSAGWRRLLDRIEACGVAIETIVPRAAAPVSTALGKLQRWMLAGGTVDGGPDGTVTIATSASAALAAEVAGQWFAADQTSAAVLVAPDSDTDLLDHGLRGAGQPRAGRSRPSPHRGSLQILLLGFKAGWAPFDAEALMELLVFPTSPIAPRAARLLAEALEAGARTRRQAMARCVDPHRRRRTRGGRRRPRPRREGASPDRALEGMGGSCRRRSAGGHAARSGPGHLRPHDRLGGRPARPRRRSAPPGDRHARDRRPQGARRARPVAPSPDARGARHRPGARRRPPQSPRGGRSGPVAVHPPSRRRMGRDPDRRLVELPGGGGLAPSALDAGRARRALGGRMRAGRGRSSRTRRERRLGTRRAQRAGPPAADRRRPRRRTRGDAAPARIPHGSGHPTASPTASASRTRRRATPSRSRGDRSRGCRSRSSRCRPRARAGRPRPRYTLRMAERVESATSFENLLSCQLMWALKHVAGLRAGRSRSIPDANRLLGNLAHALASDVFQPGPPPSPERAASMATALLEGRIDQLAAPLRHPEFAAQLSDARGRLPSAMAELARTLADNGLTVEATELQVAGQARRRARRPRRRRSRGT